MSELGNKFSYLTKGLKMFNILECADRATLLFYKVCESDDKIINNLLLLSFVS